jgi:hypothetical protein
MGLRPPAQRSSRWLRGWVCGAAGAAEALPGIEAPSAAAPSTVPTVPSARRLLNVPPSLAPGPPEMQDGALSVSGVESLASAIGARVRLARQARGWTRKSELRDKAGPPVTPTGRRRHLAGAMSCSRQVLA